MRRSSISEFLSRPQVLPDSKVKLRPKRFQDAIDDYYWRTDTELCQLDAAPPVSMSFREYLKLYAEHSLYTASQSCHFSIETLDGKHIGNCSYFNIDEDKREAEIGIMIGNKDYWNKGYGPDAIRTVINHIFSQPGIERIHLKTLDWNTRAHRCFEKCGFTPCGQLNREGYNFITMEIHRPDKETE